MTIITLTNTVDVWVASDRVGKFGDTKLFIHSLANAYEFFGRPQLPAGTIINSATLRLYPGSSVGTGSITLNVHKVTSAWDPNTITWTTQPTVGALTGSATRTWYNSGAPFDINVTADVQNMVDGGTWYGWRLSTPSTDTSQYIWSSQAVAAASGAADLQPQLIIDYSAPISAPTSLYPSSNAIVNDPKPTLSWETVGSRAMEQYSFIVQVASNSTFTTGLYTSNEIFSTATSIDLDVIAPAFTALTNGQTRWWRVKVKNKANTWSPYSAGAQFTYSSAFVANITAPTTTTSDPTPVITWTYGGTQQAYQIMVYAPLNGTYPEPANMLFDSGIIYGSTLSYELPVGVIRYENVQYTIILRVWDTSQVVSVAGVPSYNEDSQTFTWVASGATPPVQLLITAEAAPYPPRLVRWQYTGATAQRFIVTRKRFGIVDAQWSVTVGESQEGVTNWYRMVDRTPPGRADVAYSVQTVMAAGTTSTSNPEVTTKLDHLVCWVQSTTDTSKAFCLVNYEIDPGLSEITSVVRPISGPAYLAVQSFGKYNGSVAGEISWEAMPAYAALTGENMKANFLYIRKNPRVYLTWADESIEAFIYGCTIKPFGTGSGKTDYAVSFNFVQV